MGEVDGQLQATSSAEDLAPELQAEKEKEQRLLLMAAADRPPGMQQQQQQRDGEDNPSKSNCSSSNSSSRKKSHDEQEKLELGNTSMNLLSQQDERPRESDDIPSELSRGRKTRWDPPTSSETTTTTTLPTMQEDRHRSRAAGHYGNGYSEHHSDRKRYPESRRSGSAQPSFRKESTNTSNGHRSDPKSSYDRGASTAYDSRRIASSTVRNGFDRRPADWSSRSSRDRRDYRENGYDRYDREGEYRRSERDAYDRRDYRDRRTARDMEDWQNHQLQRSANSQWQAAPLLETPRYAPQPLSFPTYPPVLPSLVSALPPGPLELAPLFPSSEQIMHPPISVPQEAHEPEYQDEEQDLEPGQLLPGDEEEASDQHNNWVYYNENGDFQGPMKLAALKLLASNGFMQEDHLVSRVGSNAWITLMRAESPLNPAEYAPLKPVNSNRKSPEPRALPDAIPRQAITDSELNKRFDIDSRVQRIMEHCTLAPGNELRAITEALSEYQRRFRTDDLCGVSPDRPLCNPWIQPCELGFGVDADLSRLHKSPVRVETPAKVKKEPVEERKPVPMEVTLHSSTSSPLKFAKESWTSKGGDWKLVHLEGQSYMKVVLNNGSLLCDLRHSGLDPRRQIPQQETGKRRKLELPPWAIGLSQKSDARNRVENSLRPKHALSTSAQKTPKPAKLPTGKPDTSKLKKPDVKQPLQVPGRTHEASSIVEKPRTRCFVDIRNSFKIELSRGEWFFKNGTGAEQGPYSFTDLQSQVVDGQLPEGLSVYRKSDDVWVPLPHPESKDANFKLTERTDDRRRSAGHPRKTLTTNILQTFMGYTNGQLHEHVLKHYKTQVLSAFLFEGLDARARAIEARRKLEAPVEVTCSDEVLHGRSGGYLSPSSSNDTSEEVLKEDAESDKVSIKRAFKTLHVNGDEPLYKRKRRRRLEALAALSLTEGLIRKSGAYLSPSSSNDTSEILREDGESEQASNRRGSKTVHVNGVEKTCKKRRLARNDPDRRKGKVAVKRRKTGSKLWCDTDHETSDEEDNDMFEAEEGTESESGSDVEAGTLEYEEAQPCDMSREWGARMTKAAMVPPVTRTYEVIDDYYTVIDNELVERRMKVEVPDDFEEKLRASKQKAGGDYSHLEVPEIKDYCPRRELGEEVLEQEVYGIDPYTHNLLLDTLPKQSALTDSEKRQFVEEKLLQALNIEVRQFTGSGKAPMEFSLEAVIQRMVEDHKADANMEQICQGLLKNMRNRPKEKYVAYRKGLGVVCNKEGGFGKDDFVVGFLGEVYPAWRWFEKQDACRTLQKKEKDPAPEFYNIMLERPKGDAAGYDLLVVDAMHKANYASRICHSCRPNCEAKVTSVNMRYTIGVYTLRPIQNGEELTFDYNSVTESKEEYNNSICLCGSQGCRGSYLNLAGGGTFQEVIKEYHGLLDRHALLLKACCDGPVTKLELDEMKLAGVGTCLLDGLPDWLLKYTAKLVEFMNLERQRLPDELLRSARNKKFYDMDRTDAEVQAEGVFSQRLQNLAITLDKVRYVLRQFFTDPREAPPLLKKLEQKELVSRLWSGEDSVVSDLLRCMAPHISAEKMSELRDQIREHCPDDGSSLRECLLWLRDELRSLEPTFLSRHDAAADLIHMYAYTQCFFTSEEYGSFESPPLQITPQDLGRHSTGAVTTWKKVYKEDYVLGQLIYWFKQSAASPGASLVQARRGCLVLPDASSCYAKGLQQDSRRAYGTRLREEMLPRMERQPQRQWPKSQFWDFKSSRGLFGSPMMDAVQRGGRIDAEMMHWLKSRPVNFVGPYDE